LPLLIATPTVSGTVTAAYAQTLVAICRLCADRGIAFQHLMMDNADVVQARNYFGNLVLRDPRYRQVLFVDSDMLVPRAALERLIEREAPVAGLIYPKRDFDLDAYRRATLAGHDDATARALATTFVVKLPGRSVTVQNGFCQVDALGFGCILIKRGVLETLAAAGLADTVPSDALARLGLDGDIHDFFGPATDDRGVRLS
jgi:hypothetical protein